jgi:RHS repeat-associated protein
VGFSHPWNFIYAGGELVAIHTTEDDGKLSLPQTRHLHKDGLGSIDTITNQSGIVLQRLAYQPHGKQITQNWYNETVSTPLVKRGYTGHEHIKEFSVIHMNGRVFDPTIARFLSADPYIQAPFNTQSFNRYTYTLNNPLKYTDPSGYWFDSGDDSYRWGDFANDVKDFFGGIADAIGSAASAVGDAIGGFIDTISDAFTGGAPKNSGLELANPNPPSSYYGKFGQPINNGIMDEYTWQRPDSNIKALSNIGTISISMSNSSTKGNSDSIHTTLSGTTSNISGDKFANGAISGAFSQMYNLYGEHGDTKDGYHGEKKNFDYDKNGDRLVSLSEAQDWANNGPYAEHYGGMLKKAIDVDATKMTLIKYKSTYIALTDFESHGGLSISNGKHKYNGKTIPKGWIVPSRYDFEMHIKPDNFYSMYIRNTETILGWFAWGHAGKPYTIRYHGKPKIIDL